ncbi:hypothetical protein GCM10020358_76160 [Amorphoplanes nipponensis]|uniref:Uncharacterized protein n=1 Tax=Actinoplanes nipponensis TaxID=135950 RepID=A0A919JGG0_9ACTN|nr:hypothetical protein Ani05nite_35550 [Actinoplanes nipponensis]
MTHADNPTKVISGGNHHRSVRNVLAAIEARERPGSGFVAVVVIDVSLTVTCICRRARLLGVCVRNVWHTLQRRSASRRVREGLPRYRSGAASRRIGPAQVAGDQRAS